MRHWLNVLYAQFNGFFSNLSATKRTSIILSLVIFGVTMGVMVFIVTGKSFVPLFTKVDPMQLPQVVSKLREMNVPFKVTDGGASVTVPPELLHSTQMAIMTEAGDAKIGSIGLELFENVDIGMTSYAQRVNYQRALQGELMRSINSLSTVKRSKVILAIPPKKTFLEENGQPKASVVVDLYPGTSLTKQQIKGITNLVASSVDGLSAHSVTVLSSGGQVLSRNPGSEASALSGEILEMKERVQHELEEKIESILTKVVGTGKVIARVNAEIAMRDESQVEEIVDPDRTAVLSKQQSDDKSNGKRNNPAGVPGARANIPGAAEAGNVGFEQDTKKEFSITNYKVPTTVKKTRLVPGKVERISVAVLVDGMIKYESDEAGNSVRKWVERTPGELSKYESLIKNAIGYDDKRGDTVNVENIRFQKEDFTEAEELLSALETRKLVSYAIRWSVIAFSLALFFFLVIRPFMHWITDSFQESVDDMLPKTIEELEELQSADNTLPGMSNALPILEESIDPDKAESELLKERIMSIMDRDEGKSASALSMWLIRREL